MNRKIFTGKLRVTFMLMVLLLSLLVSSTILFAKKEIELQHGGYIFTKTGKVIKKFNQSHQFIPASTIKIVTALALLETVGPEYRFTTHFYKDNDNNLYVQGSGDPFLVSEVLADIAAKLKKHGLTEINNLYLNDSLFKLEDKADGLTNSLNPYDADNGALAANFNTIAVKVDSKRNVSSAETQTPTTPLLAEISRGLPPGTHRININSHDTFNNSSLSIRYFGEIFKFFLQRQGIVIKGKIIFNEINHEAKIILSFKSPKTVLEIISACLKYSNNYIANQLFLTLGAKKFGYPATWEKARLAMEGFLEKEFNFDKPTPVILEGSGISRKNSISPKQLLKILDRYKPWAQDTMPEKMSALMKSGTLSDVFCYAGYLYQDNKLDPFVLMLNQTENNRDTLLMKLRTDLSASKQQ